MIKLSANVSKKVPVPDVEFSSQSYSAGMEIEVAERSGKEELQKKIRSLYALLEEAIDEQIKGAAQNGAPQRNPHKAAGEEGSSPAAGNNGRRATEAQVRAIYAIGRENGHSNQEIEGLVGNRFEAKKPSELTIAQASSLIDMLKGNGKE